MVRDYLTDNAQEESTFAIRLLLVDENKAPVTPDSGAWTLTDADGTVINSRDAEAISPLSTNMRVAMSGDDLALQTGETMPVPRCFLFEGTYTSSLGSGLPLKKEVWFYIQDLVAV